MTKKVSFTEIAVKNLSDDELTKWANYLADGTKGTGTGWMTQKEIIRMADEIIRLRAEIAIFEALASKIRFDGPTYKYL